MIGIFVWRSQIDVCVDRSDHHPVDEAEKRIDRIDNSEKHKVVCNVGISLFGARNVFVAGRALALHAPDDTATVYGLGESSCSNLPSCIEICGSTVQIAEAYLHDPASHEDRKVDGAMVIGGRIATRRDETEKPVLTEPGIGD